MTQVPEPNGGFLFRRCAPGERALPGSRLLIVSSEADPRRYLPRGTPVPSADGWIGISTAAHTAHFGLADLMDYQVHTYPRRLFRLGFYGSLTFRFAHLAGLSDLLRRIAMARPDDVMVMLRQELRDAAEAALKKRFGPEAPEYPDLAGPLLPDLTAVIDRSLFDPLFAAGLCMTPGSLRIEKLSIPAVEL